MNRLTRAGLIVGVMLLFTGCASSGPGDAAESPSQTPTPTPEFATENQVASVIAGYEADWRAVMDAATSCRSDWVFSPGSITGMTCWITEQTMSITTETALRDLDALEVPPSMVDLVTDTKTDLKGIVAVDVTSVCGDAPEGPVESDACNAALGQLNMLYVGFESTLDSWGPYL